MLTALLRAGTCCSRASPASPRPRWSKAFAAALGASVRRIQFTPDLLPADITGTYVLSPKDGTFALRAGPIFANVVLADEINRAPAKTQSALLEAMQERQVTHRGRSLRAAGAVHGARHPEPDRPRGHLSAARGADRSLPRARPHRLPQRRDEVRMLRTHGIAAPEARAVLTDVRHASAVGRGPRARR